MPADVSDEGGTRPLVILAVPGPEPEARAPSETAGDLSMSVEDAAEIGDRGVLADHACQQGGVLATGS